MKGLRMQDTTYRHLSIHDLRNVCKTIHGQLEGHIENPRGSKESILHLIKKTKEQLEIEITKLDELEKNYLEKLENSGS